MTKYLRLLFPLVFLASPLLAQRGTRAIPAQAEMEKYPLHSAVIMTAGEMAKYKLHPVSLVEPTQVLNYYRNIDRFVLEMLPVGTIVLSDSSGVPRYKADCVNRLVLPSKCPACLGLLSGTNGIDSVAAAKARADSIARANGLLGSVVPVSDGLLGNKRPGFWSRFGSSFRNIGDNISSALSSLLPLLLWLAIIGLVIAGLWWLYNWIRSNRSGRTAPPAPPAPRPVVTPPAPVVSPTPPAPTPTPVPPVAPPMVAPTSPESTPPAPKSGKTFVHVALADGQSQPSTVIRHSDDINSVTYESENGVNTLRFRQK